MGREEAQGWAAGAGTQTFLPTKPAVEWDWGCFGAPGKWFLESFREKMALLRGDGAQGWEGSICTLSLGTALSSSCHLWW